MTNLKRDGTDTNEKQNNNTALTLIKYLLEKTSSQQRPTPILQLRSIMLNYLSNKYTMLSKKVYNKDSFE
jgi:hypothetical protein